MVIEWNLLFEQEHDATVVIHFSACRDGLEVTYFNPDHNHHSVDATHRKYFRRIITFQKLELVLLNL